MQLTKEIRKKFKEIVKEYGRIAAPWVQYKYKLNFKEASKLIKEFENG